MGPLAWRGAEAKTSLWLLVKPQEISWRSHGWRDPSINFPQGKISRSDSVTNSCPSLQSNSSFLWLHLGHKRTIYKQKRACKGLLLYVPLYVFVIGRSSESFGNFLSQTIVSRILNRVEAGVGGMSFIPRLLKFSGNLWFFLKILQTVWINVLFILLTF